MESEARDTFLGFFIYENVAGSSLLNVRRSINETTETGNHPRSHIKKAPCGALMMLYFAAPMRQMVVPQSGHLPLVMGLPFLVTPINGILHFLLSLALHAVSLDSHK